MTIKEIAQRANVSLGTVDRVLHKRGKVSRKTKERILAILEEVDYKPNVYARGLALNKSFVVAALVPDSEEGEYWEVPSLGIKRAVKNLGQFGIKVNFFYFDQNNVESFIERTAEVLELEPDGVILAPVINFEATKFCFKLKAKEIPFTIIDSKIHGDNYLSFIGQDSFQSGRLAAKLLVSSVPKQGKIFIISIKNNENHNRTLQQRIEGFKDFMLSASNQDLLLEEINVDQRNSDWKINLEKICSRKNIDGIYVPSSKVHFVAEIIFNKKLSIKLVGNDLINNNFKYLESGIIDYVIGQRPENQGYMALENFYKFLVAKQEISKNVFLPLDIITKENLMYYKPQIELS
ncbi:LacI family DNA-binding transcriptional regulator [Zunongwangia sp. F363]|uniref:LacI family DNA-binding transcriptional regulator n=1 Tax=Autumnicola tepida TaxID=3075595 RepID=A0ABU3C8T4_9FLAO|nr:LacI family DNA-binding transcriptional regulator [Zunongwangia sp. F363]MDT0642755.1 LacI family DNA-binding transcriptional regulator [Zunongwangia sp. F363]